MVSVGCVWLEPLEVEGGYEVVLWEGFLDDRGESGS